MTENPAYQYSLKLLSRRDYSSFKLRNKLEQKSFSEADILSALEMLQEKKYINDQSYYERKAQRLLKKNFAPHSIHREGKRENSPVSLEEIENLAQEHSATEGLKNEIRKRLNKLIKAKRSAHAASWEERQWWYKVKLKTLAPLVRKGHGLEHLSELFDAVQKDMAKLD